MAPMTKEERSAYMKIYCENHKEEIAAKRKARDLKNKEEIAAKKKIYCENHKEEIAAKAKIRYQTPNGKKSMTKSNWKSSGLIDSDGDNYEQRYQLYLQSTHCTVCKNEYENDFDRCMDHDHETGLFRQFLCRTCNAMDRWKKFI